jgi:two-component system, LytTR family, response regulator
MLKLILIDDEERVRQSITQLLQLYHPEYEVVASCPSLSSAITAIRQQPPDVVLVDIEIGHENGFDLFTAFPKPSFKVIFITAYQQYAIQAFRFAALDYLLKPIQADLLADALKRAEDELQREKLNLRFDAFLHNINSPPKADKKIVLKTAESVHLVELKDIMYCEADRGYTNFYLADKSRIMVSTTLGEYEELFESCGYCRIHQSYLLNLSYFKRYDKADGGMAILKDNTKLPVATRKKELLLQKLSEL